MKELNINNTPLPGVSQFWLSVIKEILFGPLGVLFTTQDGLQLPRIKHKQLLHWKDCIKSSYKIKATDQLLSPKKH